MALLLFSNDATTTLAAPITAASSNITLVAGSGALFPQPSGAQYFTATLSSASSSTAFEIVQASLAGTDTFVIARAQDHTIALPWNAGDNFSLRPTAGDMATFVQPDDLQAQAGNYAIDTGFANVYSVALTPHVGNHIIGMPIRWKAANTNTGACTFNEGAGSAVMVLAPGIPVPPATIIAGGIYSSFWDGTQFQLQFAANLAPYVTTAALNADLVFYALLDSPGFYGVPTAPTPGQNTRGTQIATTQFVNPGGAPFAQNGWRKNPDGTIDQWGVATAVSSTPGTTVYFPTPFPNGCVNMQATAYVNSANTFVISWGAVSFQLINGNSTQSSWRAIGY
jgi:hypothetical protein